MASIITNQAIGGGRGGTDDFRAREQFLVGRGGWADPRAAVLGVADLAGVGMRPINRQRLEWSLLYVILIVVIVGALWWMA